MITDKIAGILKPISASKAKQPVERIFTSGLETMGAITREPDKRTPQQLKDTIEAYSESIPEIKKFVQDIKELSPKHIGTIADTFELASHDIMLMTDVKMRPYLPKLIDDMIYASKNNPEGMELADAVINHTDSLTSKYALCSMSSGVLKDREVARQMHETSQVIPDIAQETLGGGYLGDFSKQERFMDFVKSLVNPKTIPEKIKSLFGDIAAFASKRPEEEVYEINIPKYVQSPVSLDKIREKLNLLSKQLDSKEKTVKGNFDLVDFVLGGTKV